MTTKRALALMGLVAILGFSQGAVAASPAAWTVTASRTAEVQLVLREPVTLDPSATVVSGGGRLAGWALVRSGRDSGLVAAELRVARWKEGSDSAVRVAAGRSGALRVPAGAYRLIAVAVSQVRIQIPVKAGKAVSVSPRAVTTARAILTDLLADGPVVAEQQRQQVTYPGNVLLSGTYFRAQAHQAEVVAQCFAPVSEQAKTCVNQQGFTSAVPSPASVGDGYTYAFTAAYGDEFRKGTQIDVLLQAVDVDAPSFAEWLVFTA